MHLTFPTRAIKNLANEPWKGGAFLDSVLPNQDVMYNQAQAKEEFKKGNYPLACAAYKKLWENSGELNQYLLSWYGRCLRKIGDNTSFIEVCDELLASGQQLNKYVIDLFCWCIYDSIIKSFSVEDTDGLLCFLQRAEYITQHSQQLGFYDESKTPFVLTIKKVVKIFRERASINYKEIIVWLTNLNPDILSEDVLSFKDSSGR